MDYGVITFTSTYGAIYAQKVLGGQIPVQVMPVLREISLGCGISLRLAPGHVGEARRILAGSGLTPEEYAFYGVSGTGAALRTEALTG